MRVSCPHCKALIDIKEARMISLPQHKYYFGVIVDLLSNHTGYTKKEIDYILKEEFWFDILHVNTKSGIKEIRVIKSKTEMTTSEAEEFYSNCRRFGSQLEPSCYIPEPNEETPE